MSIIKKSEFWIDGEYIGQGDDIRIDGEKGQKFTFLWYAVNTESGAEWIDCIHKQKGDHGPFRSFHTHRARIVGKRKKKQ